MTSDADVVCWRTARHWVLVVLAALGLLTYYPLAVTLTPVWWVSVHALSHAGLACEVSRPSLVTSRSRRRSQIRSVALPQQRCPSDVQAAAVCAAIT